MSKEKLANLALSDVAFLDVTTQDPYLMRLWQKSSGMDPSEPVEEEVPPALADEFYESLSSSPL